MGPIDHLQRRDADRAARPVHQFNLGRQDAIDAVFDDRVGLAAADFHDRPGPGDRGGNLGGELLHHAGIAILVEVFHGDGVSSSSSWFIWLKKSNTRWASASSISDSANPT